ncbi:hypothetical protein [Roseateles sp. LKC17W]|uniref:Uncharacterized protein n=1 Tax=Pelomonas margarita TaxID=3299031 RepID=A0ABW7FDU5_9BURK
MRQIADHELIEVSGGEWECARFKDDGGASGFTCWDSEIGMTFTVTERINGFGAKEIHIYGNYQGQTAATTLNVEQQIGALAIGTAAGALVIGFGGSAVAAAGVGFAVKQGYSYLWNKSTPPQHSSR